MENPMNRLITLALVLFVFTQPVFAERDKKGEHMDRFTKELQLNDDQVDPVKDILKEQRQKHLAIREQVKPQMEAIHEETKQRLSTVLDSDQLQQFEKMTNKWHERMKNKFDHHKSRSNKGYPIDGHDYTDIHP